MSQYAPIRSRIEDWFSMMENHFPGITFFALGYWSVAFFAGSLLGQVGYDWTDYMFWVYSLPLFAVLLISHAWFYRVEWAEVIDR